MALAINFNTNNLSLSIKTTLTSGSNKRSNGINNNLRLKSKKCLFGPTNPEETYQMVKENIDQERERFYERFGIHMEDLDRLAIDEDEYKQLKAMGHFKDTSCSNLAAGGGKIVNRKLGRMKRVLKPYNAQEQSSHQQQNQHQPQMQTQQMKMTDFCQVKKSPTNSLQFDIMKKQQQNQNGL